MAARLALLSFAPYIQGKCVQIVSDNITTVAYLNHLGGPVQELSVLTQTIFMEAQQANATLSAHFLAEKHNTEADRLSRLNAYSWKLHPNLLRFGDLTPSTALPQQTMPKYLSTTASITISLHQG